MKKRQFLPLLAVIVVLMMMGAKAAIDNSLATAPNSSATPAENPETEEVDYRDQIEQIQDLKENLTNDELRSQFLKAEWGKLLSKTSAGPYIQQAQEKITIIDPVFETLLGLTFTFSWFFVLTLYLYIWFLTNSYDLSIAVQAYAPKRFARALRWVAWIAFFILISSIRVPRFLAALAIDGISLAGNWGLQFIMFVILVLIFVVASKYVKFINKSARKMIEAKSINEAIKTTKKQKKEQEELKDDLRKGKYDKGPTLEEEAEQEAKDDFEGISRAEP